MDPDSPKKLPMLRAIQILECLARADRPLASSEIAEMLSLPKQTVHRIVRTLLGESLVQRVPHGKRLVAGARLVDLARAVSGNVVVNAPRRAVLTNLSAELDATCNLTMIDGDALLYLDRVEANWPLRIQLPIGSRQPLHCTASGKVLLAYQPKRLRQSIVERLRLEPYARRTITSRAKLEETLDAVRHSGIGEDDEEFLDGIIGIAVPVLDGGPVCTTVAITAPTSRRTMADLHRGLPEMRRAAASIAKLSGLTAT